MKIQNYQNHIRFYVPHHFIFYPVTLVLIGASVWGAYKYPERSFECIGFAVILVLIVWLSLMLRQHYALVLQNRIVRLEMRLRYYQLTQQRFEPLEQQLSFEQLAALRFAGDDELADLIIRTLKERLSPDVIKKSIRQWEGDHMRV